MLIICFSCRLKIPNYKKTATAKLSVKVLDKNIGLSGVLKRNTLLGSIPSWGPLYRISFDLKINSLSRAAWTNVISFKGNGAKNNYGKHGDRVPAVFMDRKGRILVSSSVGANPHHPGVHSLVQLRKWLHVTIEQYPLNGKVNVK